MNEDLYVDITDVTCLIHGTNMGWGKTDLKNLEYSLCITLKVMLLVLYGSLNWAIIIGFRKNCVASSMPIRYLNQY